jgi:hypothetical protein
MPFQDNPYFTPLYDTLRGGGPRAWECHMAVLLPKSEPGHSEHVDCGKITKTLNGMFTHLIRVHNFTPQQAMDFTTRVLANEVKQEHTGSVNESGRENPD